LRGEDVRCGRRGSAVLKSSSRLPERTLLKAFAVAQDATWKTFFAEWSGDLPRKGIVVTVLSEQIPFKGFMTSADIVLLERTNPDPLGTRLILIPYDQISIVKLTEVVGRSVFSEIGFSGKLSGR